MLCDFGLARLEEDVPSGLTTARGKEGSTCYLSPELVRDTASRTAKSDVWARGCLFMEVSATRASRLSSLIKRLPQTMTGLAPFRQEKRYEGTILRLMENAKPVNLEDPMVPEKIRGLLEICWEERPEDRPTMNLCAEKVQNLLEVPSPASAEPPLAGPLIDLGDRDKPSYSLNIFSPHPVTYEGKEYPTGEHLFQAFKVGAALNNLILCDSLSPSTALSLATGQKSQSISGLYPQIQ